MRRSRLWAAALAAAALVGGTAACRAGPCTGQITELQAQIARAQATSAPGGAGAPSAPQSLDAQLHHQPTPSSVGAAESKASADARAALDRARQADAAGDAAACQRALQQAKDIFGLP